ncbi:MAG: hypothetical protein JW910_06125, partial [Anaerolineae bacterium]|nr:hypothetical protein [Anaerolineae bacterium]
PIDSPYNIGDTRVDINGAVDGYFYRIYLNDSAPFQGALDDVRIYREALDPMAVEDLYWAGSTALHLRLDDPPGETSFKDVMGQHDGTCSGAACPTAGVSGRLAQAVLFRPEQGDHIAVSNFGDFQQPSVSAWVYRNAATDGAQAIFSYKESAGCGLALELGKSGASYCPTFRAKIGGTWQQAQQTVDLPVNTWVHLAGVYDGAELKLYRNGVEVATTTAAGLMAQCTGVSAVGSISAGTGKYFSGLLDDVKVFSIPLTADQVTALYKSAAVMLLHLEEARYAESFADATPNGNAAVCASPNCPSAGEIVQGRLGTAVEFDGAGDKLSVPDASSLDLTRFSIGGWFYPTRDSDGSYPQELIGKYRDMDNGSILEKQESNYRLYLKAGAGLTPVLEFWSDPFVHGWKARFEVSSAVQLTKNVWNHVMGTYDGHTLTIYVNGAPQGSETDSREIVPAQTSHPVYIGGYKSQWPYRFDTFQGRMDEISIYPSALSARDVYDLWHTQASWVEDRQNTILTVDADAPESEVQPYATYLPKTPVQLLITASDYTSGVAGADLGSCAGTCSPSNWAAAPACQDSLGDGAWCPTFSPGAEGRFTLGSRARDIAGNQAVDATTSTVFVDDSPPNVTLSFTADARLSVTPDPVLPSGWRLSLSGTAADPALPDGASGSGVPDDGVKVSVFTPSGGLVGREPMLAALSGSSWSVDYPLSAVDPSGGYTVRVVAVDNITRLPNLDDTQLARHTTTLERAFQIDAAAPAVMLDRAAAPEGIAGVDTVWSGAAAERPVSIVTTWTVSSPISVTVQCAGVTLAQVTPDMANTRWSGQAAKGSACSVAVGDTTSAGTVRVCGEQVANWAVGQAGPFAFTATSSGCA